MATESRWRTIARRTIAHVLAGLPGTANRATKLRAIRGAYPFGERAMQPYKAWLAEVNAAVPKEVEPAPIRPFVGFTLTARPSIGPRWFISVVCDWCDVGSRSSGCMVCGVWVERLRSLLASAETHSFLIPIRLAPDDAAPRRVFADWLDEHEETELATLFRESPS